MVTHGIHLRNQAATALVKLKLRTLRLCLQHCKRRGFALIG